MIAIIDYGMGNLRSVQKAFESMGYQAVVTRDRQRIADADHLVLPGVGAFPDCMRNLEQFDLVGPLLDGIDQGKPFLGICLGLQLLFTESEEFGPHKGLDLIKGRVVRFPEKGLKIPHMGWNQLRWQKPHPLLEGLSQEVYVYFVHSYYVVPEDTGVIATRTDYGIEFASSVAHDNIFACQFHPEKSQEVGLKILKNFGKLK
ncbi:MAG: imidazole glycerol phosphate synthase subunit HisH [Nitrospiria bacterium]